MKRSKVNIFLIVLKNRLSHFATPVEIQSIDDYCSVYVTSFLSSTVIFKFRKYNDYLLQVAIMITGCALGLTMKDVHSFDKPPILTHFFLKIGKSNFIAYSKSEIIFTKSHICEEDQHTSEFLFGIY